MWKLVASLGLILLLYSCLKALKWRCGVNILHAGAYYTSLRLYWVSIHSDSEKEEAAVCVSGLHSTVRTSPDGIPQRLGGQGCREYQDMCYSISYHSAGFIP